MREEYERARAAVAGHALLREAAEDPARAAAAHIEADRALPLVDKVQQLGALHARMDGELQRLEAEKHVRRAEAAELLRVLGEHAEPPLGALTLGELGALLRSLADRLAIRRAQLQSSAAVVAKLWALMAVPAAETFVLDPTDCSHGNWARLEAEKRRLFDVQKERFREMLAAQERELAVLWVQLGTPAAARQAVLDAMRSRTRARTALR